MSKPVLGNQRGLTLMDTLAATLMMLTVVGAMFTLYRFQMFGMQSQNAQLETQYTGRAILDLMTREVRQAGADPTCTNAIEGISEASGSKLTIRFDRNANGAIDPNESVTYEIHRSDKWIKRTAGGTTSVLATSRPRTGTGFSYYDGNGATIIGTQSGGFLTAAQRASVRSIRLQVGLDLRDWDPLTTSTEVGSTFTTDVDLRNRWMNGQTSCPP
jgi:hypothetical protein